MTDVVDNFNPVITGTFYGDANTYQNAIWAGRGMPSGYLENFDFSQAKFYNFQQINFNWMAMDMPGKATFSSAQFGPGLISDNVQIFGAWGRTDVIVNMTANGNLDMSHWQFMQGQYYNWLAGEDYVLINGASGSQTVIGSPVSDIFVFKGKLADYKISSNGGGGLVFIDSVAGRDGTENISGVEFFSFADQTVPTSSLSAYITPVGPKVTAPAAEVLSPNQTKGLGSLFIAEGSPSIDAWLIYETGSGQGASNGHVHVNNGYIFQNNSWSAFSGDVPTGTLVAVSASEFNQAFYSAPKVVGIHDDLYAGYVSGGQWSNVGHVSIST